MATETTTSGGTISYTYNSLNLISELTNARGQKRDFTYDDVGRINSFTDAEGTTTYTYDNNGNILTVTDANGTITRQFHGLNRVTKYTDVNGKVIQYTYDANGNIGILNGSAANFTYDSGNRLMQAGGISYEYDADNNRISSTINEQTTKYVYDTQGSLSRLLVSTDSSGNSTYYVYGMGLIGSQDGSDNYSIYHYDYRGSTTAITNINGTVTDRYTYGAYGKLESHTGTSTTLFLYNGRDGVMTDSNGLYYLRSRYYSPELMRFINADIVKGTITSSVTLNRYAYLNENPVSLVDPFGTSAEPGNGTVSNMHAVLDVLGMIPGYGMVFDAINGVWYASEGNWTNASISAFSFVPIVGDIGGAGRAGYKTPKMGSSIGKKVMNFIQDEGGYIDLDKLLGITKNGDEVEAGLKRVREPEIVLPSKPHTNGTEGHWETILNEVDVMKNSGDYKKIYVNRGLSNEIPRAKPNRRPDVMGVRHDGIIDQVEVPSKTDDPADLIERMIDNQRIIGDRAGIIKIRPIDK